MKSIDKSILYSGKHRFHIGDVGDNVPGLEQPRNDDHAAGPGSENLVGVFKLDAADAVDRKISTELRVHRSNVVHPDGGSAGLGGCLEQRAEADIVGTFIASNLCLNW